MTGRWRMVFLALCLTATWSSTLVWADAREDWRALSRQWETHFDAGRYREAEPFARQMVDLAERSLTNVPTLIAASYNNLGLTYRGLARYADAEQALLKTLKLFEQILGPQHLDVARTLTTWGTCIATRDVTNWPRRPISSRWRFGKPNSRRTI